MMSNLNLYLAAVAIWSSTWLAIRMQLGLVPPSVSVVWRFALAALILLSYAAWKRLPLRFSPREHIWIAVQGVFLFGINYIFVYASELYLASGLVAVICSLGLFSNILAMRLFFATRIAALGLLGAILGVAGVVLVFWPEMMQLTASSGAITGAIFALAATAFATLGTVAATRNHRNGLPVVQVNAWAMLYGALFVALYALVSGQDFAFDWSLRYTASLVYLALFGSVLAFGAYLTLMSHIGAERASYVAVAVPVLALVLSTLFEGVRWQTAMAVGIALCLAGNLLVLSRGKA
jgi:drug/metabolite transporter (DMT)-like permease